MDRCTRGGRAKPDRWSSSAMTGHNSHCTPASHTRSLLLSMPGLGEICRAKDTRLGRITGRRPASSVSTRPWRFPVPSRRRSPARATSRTSSSGTRVAPDRRGLRTSPSGPHPGGRRHPLRGHAGRDPDRRLGRPDLPRAVGARRAVPSLHARGRRPQGGRGFEEHPLPPAGSPGAFARHGDPQPPRRPRAPAFYAPRRLRAQGLLRPSRGLAPGPDRRRDRGDVGARPGGCRASSSPPRRAS